MFSGSDASGPLGFSGRIAELGKNKDTGESMSSNTLFPRSVTVRELAYVMKPDWSIVSVASGS